ncbi:hypothetical protein HW115_04560 [Verrucomicrobiaceae bacterium N1E253]|uniref:Uncharacterized protein n=1 Tax=Oceaniferula marina TaxID=2748318 RepID=A0A851GAS6_9BACT|nr:hypothetical protein [Oceaniferula marina]NWK54868.1 hypothetical protein [Oceaniferula marina]
MVKLTFFSVLMVIASGAGALWAQDTPPNLPAGFRLIGHYQLKSKIKVENGEAMPVVISPLKYRVYSDGIDVRVYCRTAGEESYTSYQIYRSDGIGVAKPSGELQVIAGVQGICKKGEMMRQISVTRTSLTMVKMPPRSHRVLVTRAISVGSTGAIPKTD